MDMGDAFDQNVSPENMSQLEYLFAQSIRGVHLLFDNQQLAKILSQPSEELDVFSFDNLDRVQAVFSEFANRKTLEEKRAYMDSLDEETFEILVRTYFNIVENAVLESTDLKH